MSLNLRTSKKSKKTNKLIRKINYQDNVNYDDDLLSIKPANAEKALVKYEDYAVLLRNGHPYITLKVTDHTTPYALLNTPHTIIYRTS